MDGQEVGLGQPPEEAGRKMVSQRLQDIVRFSVWTYRHLAHESMILAATIPIQHHFDHEAL